MSDVDIFKFYRHEMIRKILFQVYTENYRTLSSSKILAWARAHGVGALPVLRTFLRARIRIQQPISEDISLARYLGFGFGARRTFLFFVHVSYHTHKNIQHHNLFG